MTGKLLRTLGFMVERMDIPILVPSGTNLMGLTLMLAAFLPLGILIQQFGARIEGVVNFIGGGILFGVDWICRRKFDILFEPKQGGRLFWLPCWIWGVLWMILGFIIVLLELIKG